MRKQPKGWLFFGSPNNRRARIFAWNAISRADNLVEQPLFGARWDESKSQGVQRYRRRMKARLRARESWVSIAATKPTSYDTANC